MKKSKIFVVGAVVLSLGLSGCSGDGQRAPEKTTLSFWGWAPGQEKAVAAFNSSHPNVTVTYQEMQPGAKGGYQKLLNAVQAKNAPCLAQVGYETLPSFAAQGALLDVAGLANVNKEDLSTRGVEIGVDR